MDSPGGCPNITRDRFPHSEIPGSKFVCNYPRLIAAYHVLRRLLVPRHPPCALSNLIGILSIPNDTQNDIEDARFLILYEVVKDQIQPCFLAKPNKISKSFNGDNPASCGITFPPSAGRSPNYSKSNLGGDNRDRTGNLRLAKPALSQLSYIPGKISS